MKNVKYFVLALIVATIHSCGKDDAQPVDLGLDYFPVEVGKYVEFLVDSSFVDEQFGASAAVTVQYELREVIAEEFIDQAGRTVQRLERLVKDSVGEWIIRDVWTQFRSDERAERVEENQRKFRLAFRPGFDKVWDLNAFNTDQVFANSSPFEFVEMTYEEIDEPYTVNGMFFDSTVAVNTTYPSNLILELVEYERFAKGVGLIEKEWVEVEAQFNGSTGDREETGFRVKYTLIGYGTL